MADLLSRLQRVTQELLEVNAELEQEMAQLASERGSELLKQLGLLKTFKGIVDHTRHLVWPFLLGAEQRAENNISYVMQVYRMERIRQMVAALREESEPVSEATQLFFAELRRMTGSPERPN